MIDLKKLRDLMQRTGESKIVVSDNSDTFVVLAINEYERLVVSARIPDSAPVDEPEPSQVVTPFHDQTEPPHGTPHATLVEPPTPETSLDAIEHIIHENQNSGFKPESPVVSEEWIEQELEEAPQTSGNGPGSNQHQTPPVLENMSTAGIHYEKPGDPVILDRADLASPVKDFSLPADEAGLSADETDLPTTEMAPTTDLPTKAGDPEYFEEPL